MRINTNLTALSAAHNLNKVQDSVAKSSEKLSSGFRINRAADDAAGLGIANTFQSDVRAFVMASSNAEQAQGVFNIAEGSTSSIVSMLQRMKELAVQAASDTVDSAARTRADGEFQALNNEIQRTIATTKFQGNALLDGTYGSTLSGTVVTATSQYSGVSANGVAAGSYTLSSVGAAAIALENGSQKQTISGLTVANAQTLNFSSFGISIGITAGQASTGAIAASGVLTVAAGSGNFQVGNGTTSNDKITVTGTDFDVKTLTNGVLGSVTNATNALAAITAVNTALDTTSTVLGKIGAYSSRVSSALDVLKNTIQNFTAAESTIRDVDMASEMVKFSKNQILAQAGTAMLAQANQSGQSVLKLFQ